MNFKTFIKAVGTGPKGNRDLSFEESFEAVSQILKQEPTQAQMGAFLIAWRVKLETNEEFKGAIKALNSFACLTSKKKYTNNLIPQVISVIY